MKLSGICLEYAAAWKCCSYEWVPLPCHYESTTHNLLYIPSFCLSVLCRCEEGQTHLPLCACGHLGTTLWSQFFPYFLRYRFQDCPASVVTHWTFLLTIFPPLFFLTRPPVILPNSPFHRTHVDPWLASLLKTHFLCSLTNLSQFCGPGETTLDTMWNEDTQRKEEERYSVLSLTKSAHLWEQTASVTCCVTSHLSVRCTHLLMWSVGGLEDFLQIAWNFLSWRCLD